MTLRWPLPCGNAAAAGLRRAGGRESSASSSCVGSSPLCSAVRLDSCRNPSRSAHGTRLVWCVAAASSSKPARARFHFRVPPAVSFFISGCELSMPGRGRLPVARDQRNCRSLRVESGRRPLLCPHRHPRSRCRPVVSPHSRQTRALSGPRRTDLGRWRHSQR